MEEMETEFLGWGSSPFDKLKKLEDSKQIVVKSKKITKKKLPILKGDTGEKTIFSRIEITYTGNLW